jgi:hypothetical protein
MNTGVLTKGFRPRRVRAGKMALLGATIVAGVFAFAPASAGLDLELPPLPQLPLPLPTLTPSVELPVSGTVDTVTTTVTGITETVGGIVGGGGGGGGTKPVVKPVVKQPLVDSWSLERLPGLQGSGAASEMARTTISSSRLNRPGAYTSLIGNGLRATAGRALDLAGPLAAPIVVAMFALALLVVAARGPGKLVKVDEERQMFRERRSHRL